jgi:hypothetical protein
MQFEPGRVLAAGEVAGGAKIGSPRISVVVGVSAQQQQFGVVEMHFGLRDKLQAGVQSGTGLAAFAGGDQQPPEYGRCG